ncbi:PA2169 family four-helix-bundle protein [soil metagenome]
MTDSSHDISTLNGLIATTIDSADGYAQAAREAEGHQFGALFTSRAGERREIAGHLQREVESLGGNAEDDGTILAGAHRVFLNLKATVTGHDDKAIINEVEAGEDHIKDKFEDALADSELSLSVKAIIEQSYAKVKAGHDEIRDIKHSMER